MLLFSLCNISFILSLEVDIVRYILKGHSKIQKKLLGTLSKVSTQNNTQTQSFALLLCRGRSDSSL